ncbi:MAG: SDR family NAD(P)-dependent oxidoreductase [Prevotella sp.]|nr:SDR family NAD(P)-dependent oxidoreductase [Prevotella sp.]
MNRIIIVGASSGIGREVALRYIRQGWKAGLAARRTDRLDELRAMYPGQVVTMPVDVQADDAPERLLSLIEANGGVDIYFHAAGVGWQNPDLDPSVELATANTNVAGFTRMIDTIFNYMRARKGGHIAVISSIAGTKGLGPAPAYSATKAFQSVYIQALEQLANSLRLPIKFTDIRPGFVDTDLLKGGKYPMLMDRQRVAGQIKKAIDRKKHVCVIDWRYRWLTRAWRLLPSWLWRRMDLVHRN